MTTANLLPSNLASRLAAVRARRQAEGLNVRFVNAATGAVDTWSFRTKERAAAFREKCRQDGSLLD